MDIISSSYKIIKLMEYLCWLVGCANMGLSLGFQAYGYHSKSLDQVGRDSMLRATNVH